MQATPTIEKGAAGERSFKCYFGTSTIQCESGRFRDAPALWLYSELKSSTLMAHPRKQRENGAFDPVLVVQMELHALLARLIKHSQQNRLNSVQCNNMAWHFKEHKISVKNTWHNICYMTP